MLLDVIPAVARRKKSALLLVAVCCFVIGQGKETDADRNLDWGPLKREGLCKVEARFKRVTTSKY